MAAPEVDVSVDEEGGLTRRTLLGGMAAGVVATLVPFRRFDAAAAAAPAAAGVFGYGVASGDPTGTSLIIWTRATPTAAATPGVDAGPGLTVTWQVARDPAFTVPVATGTVPTSAADDYTVKVDVTGLAPYTRYYYRFLAGGETSRVGRTQTQQDDGRHPLRFAFVSCSNYTGGYFTAYRGIAQRDDLDFVLHLGDYIYEYGEGATADDRYGPAALAGVRDGIPATETVTLTDYRLRHALHKADPDLALAHQRHPWITIFDDHEVCDNTWATDGGNHTTATEGDFLVRKAAAYKAYLEWMPIRLPDQGQPHQGTRFFRRFTFGGLADLSVLETRQNRSEQVEFNGSKGGGFVPATTTGLTDPARHLPEPEQRAWLKGNLAGTGQLWHLIGNQVVFVPAKLGGDLVNSDAWDGYQFDRDDIVAAAAQPPAAGDAVIMTGDIHSSWASDVPSNPTTYPAVNNSTMVEFVCPSITSDGFKEVFGGATEGQAVATSIVQSNPWVKYLDGVGHGYCVLDVTPARVQADYWFIRSGGDKGQNVDVRVDPNAVAVFETSWQTVRGSRRLSTAGTPSPVRTDVPAEVSGSVPTVPDGVGPAALVAAGALGAAALAWQRRRAAVAREGSAPPAAG